MLAQIRARLTYANVMATIAVFIALGGVAWAAATIGSRDVVNDSLKSVDLKDGKGVKNADVVPDSLSGAAIDEATLDLPQVVSNRVQPDISGQVTVVDAGGVRIRAACGVVGLVSFQNTTGFPARVIEVEGGTQAVGAVPSGSGETTLEETAGRARVTAQVLWGQNLNRFTTFTVLYDRPGGCPAEAWGQAVTTILAP